MTQWALKSLIGKETRTTLVLALAFCYTGFGTMVGYPCKQVMAKLVKHDSSRRKKAINRSRWRSMIFHSVSFVRD
jgi:hypothetical protein